MQILIIFFSGNYLIQSGMNTILAGIANTFFLKKVAVIDKFNFIYTLLFHAMQLQGNKSP